MNIILLKNDDYINGTNTVLLNDHRHKHVFKILKPVLGQSLKVGIMNGRCGYGRVICIDPEKLVLEVFLHDQPPPRHQFDLILALPRPKMLRRILRTIAEFGVQNLYLINSARVEKSYWQSPFLYPENIQKALMRGMERSKDPVMTNVSLHKRFRPFIEDQLADICGSRPCWITDMHAKHSAIDMDIQSQPSIVMIGPEGGFVSFEVALATSRNAKSIHLGSRVLSVDTAITTVLAQALPS